VITINQIINTS